MSCNNTQHITTSECQQGVHCALPTAHHCPLPLPLSTAHCPHPHRPLRTPHSSVLRATPHSHPHARGPGRPGRLPLKSF